MLHKTYKSSLIVALFTMLIVVSSINAQDMGHKKMMKKQTETAAVDVTKADVNGDGNVFVCSMGYAVVDTAGRCPICEMKMDEMKVADAEKMLKDKGYDVVEHRMMKKNCCADCQKPCRAKKDVAMAKKCKSNCEKPCCAKKTEAVSDAKPFNSVCPVSGKAVSDNSPTFEYDGQTYRFCCSQCVAKFESDPEKYSQNLSEDGSQFKTGTM